MHYFSFECVQFYFLYTCSAYLHEIVLDLEYFVASRQCFYDRHGRDHTYCTNTNIWYFLWESITTTLSVLFATEACYTIKGNNNKENHFVKLPFCRNKLSFCWRKLKKAYFVSGFFCRHKLRKAYFASAFSCRGKKVWIARLMYF